jgi:starvation-inducible outer membrane lipoprotein
MTLAKQMNDVRLFLSLLLLFVVIALLLVGCATAPGEVWSTGTRTSFASAKTPRQVARCIARNAENGSGYLIAQERIEDDGSAEVIVRSTLELVTTIAVAKIQQTANGSSVELAISTDAIAPGRLRERLVKGCG